MEATVRGAVAQVYRRQGHWWGTFESGKRRSLKMPKSATEAQARRRWLELATDSAQTPAEPTVGVVAFSGLAKLWLDVQDEREAAGRLRQSSLDRYHRIVRLHLLPYWGDEDARAISPLDVERFQARLGSKLKPTTSNQIVDALRSIFELGKKGRYLDNNPATGLPALKVTTEAWDWYSLEETVAFLDAVAKVAPRWHRWYLLAFRTGLRSGELSGLDWGDVDLSAAQLHVRRTWCPLYGERPPKGGKPRVVPLTSDAVEVLRAQRLETALSGQHVFVAAKGGRERADTAGEVMARAALAAGLRQIRPHDTRHSFASQLVSAGVPIMQVAKLLGHANVTTTFRTYAHLAPETLAGAVSALETGTNEVQNGVATKWSP